MGPENCVLCDVTTTVWMRQVICSMPDPTNSLQTLDPRCSVSWVGHVDLLDPRCSVSWGGPCRPPSMYYPWLNLTSTKNIEF